jgi:Stress responsive A/B Barrel Domain
MVQRMVWLGAIVVVIIAVAALVAHNSQENSAMAADQKQAGEAQLAHMVFFTLKDRTEANRKRLVDSCKKHLGDHPGTVYFSVGTLNAELKREVNDQDFDVALHLVFKDKATQDKYQTDPRHLQFIDESKALWSKVRVFDSDVR